MKKIDNIKAKLETQPENAHLWYLLAWEHEENQDYTSARNALCQALLYATDDFAQTISKDIERVARRITLHQTEPCQIDQNSCMDAENMEVAEDADLVDSLEGENVIHLNGFKKPVVTFSHVHGIEEVKSAISMKIIQPMLHPELFKKFNQTMGGGILLFGPPGCGKTYIAKATAGECGASFINLRITDILDCYIGESEKNIENVFIKARREKPSIIFVDEIDMLGYSRAKMRGESIRGVVDQFLTEMEGMGSDNQGILVIGATNMPWDVDTALKRPGRFDRTIFVPPPSENARAKIFQAYLKNTPSGLMDYAKLAQMSRFFSGADIRNVVEQASEIVLKEILQTGNQRRQIEQNDIQSVIANKRPSTLEWLRTISDFVRYSNQTGQYNDVERFLEENKGYI